MRAKKRKIPVANPYLGKEELDNVIKAVKDGWISSKGEFIGKFENEFAKYCGMKYGVATFNGTVALHLALAALGIKKGDEVIVPTLTFVATANAVTYCGAKSVFVDSHPDYWCIDPGEIEKKITKKTKAIIPVHLYGHPCDMDPIMKIAKRHRLHVIEDCAEAHGAEYKGRKVGSFGDVNCFSFFGNKIITTGEGGMCVTNNKKLARKMRILRDHGMNLKKRYWHDMLGFNYRMTNLQAAIGLAQVKKLDTFIDKGRKIAGWYKKKLGNLEEKNLVSLHPEMPWAKRVHWMYSILIENKFGVSRNNLMKELAKRGIETRPLFYPVHSFSFYKKQGNFPVAEGLSQRGISLPNSVGLPENDVNFISEEMKKAVHA